MKIKIERSGGIAGIVTSKEVDTNTLPSSVGDAVRSILKSKMSGPPRSSVPRGAGDHFNYRITIHDGTNDKVIECNEYNIKNDLKDIIRYVETYSKKH